MRGIGLVLALTLLLGIGTEGIGVQLLYAQQAPDPRIADLVKAGKLQVGLGLGSAALALKDPATGEVRGPALDLGRALAVRIGVELQPVEYPKPGAILEGARTNAWDVALLIVYAARTGEADFSPSYMESDVTYVVLAGSSIRNVADVDQSEVRIAEGSSSNPYLSGKLKRAKLVFADSLPAALDLVRTGHAEAWVAPRAVLLAQVANVPGFRVLEDRVAVLSYAALVPKGHAGRLAYVSEFIEEAKASGLVKQTIERHGLQGVQVSPAGTKGTQ
jgi:polar amino acid transport system substrate-binding protein